MTVVRYNKTLEETIGKIKDLKQRYTKINVNDTSGWNNQGAAFTRQLWNMLELAEVMTTGALLRNESRGAHYKPEFPERDDDNFMKTTKAAWTPDGPQISYEDVDVSLIKPRKRDYTTDKKKGGN
jgi:succinate dehydrogenase / fumarate reductase, flavoprotein subunit